MTSTRLRRRLWPSLGAFWGKRAARFPASQRGNVAVLFAFALVPIMGLVGAAVDYSRANKARSSMQAALDSTALMMSRDAAGLTQSEIEQRARDYFSALYRDPDVQLEPLAITYTPNTGNGATIAVKASGTMKTDFMKVVGFPTLDFNSSGAVTWGAARLRVAMALDVTLSMASAGKMTALKSAATDLLTTLQNTATQDGDVHVSIVPFNVMINVGPSNYTANWINWKEWEAEPALLDPDRSGKKPNNWDQVGPGSNCPFTNSSHGFTCTDRPATASGARAASKIPSSGTYAGMICPSVDNGSKKGIFRGIYYNGCYTSIADVKTISSGRNASCGSTTNCSCSGSGNNKVCEQTTYKHPWRDHPTDVQKAKAAAPDHSTWDGCIADRNQSYDTTADPPSAAGALFPAVQYKDCPVATKPLSYDWPSLTTKIDEMEPKGYTNQGIGMAWGWLSLLQQAPLNAPGEDANYKYNRVVILLSDGDNTQNRFATSVSAIDDRQKILCDNAKNAGIEVYTVQVNTDNSANSSVMEYCASLPKNKHFFSTTTAGGMAAAFGQIATQLSELRISK